MTPAELKHIMAACGWTQSRLARLLPLKSPRSTRSIRYWLSGHHPIREVIARRIEQLQREHEHGKERL